MNLQEGILMNNDSALDEQNYNQSSSEPQRFFTEEHLVKEIESLKSQLEKEKQTNKKITSNVKKLKKKLIDVSSLLELQDNLKKKIEEQVLEIMKLHQHNQSLLEKNENLQQQCSKLEKSAKSSITTDQSQIIQQLRFEKMSMENTISSLKNDLEQVKSEKEDLSQQIEQNQSKLRKYEFLNNQVQELRGLLTHTQKELSELREQRGFISYADFAVVKPTTPEENTKKDYKSIALNTDPIQMDWSKCPNCNKASLGSNIDVPFNLHTQKQPSRQSHPSRIESPPHSIIPTSSPSTTPSTNPSTTPQQHQQLNSSKSQHKRKIDEKLSSFKKPKQSERQHSYTPQLPTLTASDVSQPPPVLPKLKKVVSIQRNTDSSSPHLPFLQIDTSPPEKVAAKHITITENQKSSETTMLPDIPSIYFMKKDESVAQYIETMFMNFICNFETFISDKVSQARVLGEIVKTCKTIWKHYSQNSTQIIEGVSHVLIRLITGKATFVQWNLFIIMLDHLDIYSCQINLLEKLLSEAERFVSQVLLEKDDHNDSKLITLLAGLSTISNTRFARLDFCMFSKMKELFYNILQFSLRNERNKTLGFVSTRCVKLLLAMVSSNKRLLRNGFDSNSSVDLVVALVFKQMMQSSHKQLNDELVIRSVEKLLEFCALELSTEDVCDMLLNNIDNISTQSSQIPNSIVLISLSVNDWNWTFNYLIFGRLWPRLLHYLSHQSHEKLQIILTSICKLAISRSQLHPQKVKWQPNDPLHDGQLQLLEKFKGILLLDNVFTFETVKLAADAMSEILVNRLSVTTLEQDLTTRSNHKQQLKEYADFLKEWYLKKNDRVSNVNISNLIDVI